MPGWPEGGSFTAQGAAETSSGTFSTVMDHVAQGFEALGAAFGGTLLLGLEVLVAADLVRTVAVAPTLDNVLVLGLIVLIRTVLSFSLEAEIEGVAPWRRAQ